MYTPGPRLALAALFCAALLMAPQAVATSFSTDQSDLWWSDPPGSEDGWGIQLVQRNATIFATMFVYGPGGTPTWYVATMNPTGGPFSWSGDLYTATGSPFSAVPYNPALFTIRKVGTMAWTGTSVTTGSLTYSVDGVLVSKNLTRQVLAIEDYSGHYGGGIHQVAAGCANAGFNGTIETVGTLDITQSGSTVTLASFPISGGSCSYAGTLTQAGDGVGRRSFVVRGENGTFQLFEMQVNITGMTGRFTGHNNTLGCTYTGWFGGLRVTTF
jgi:hypothetical protein